MGINILLDKEQRLDSRSLTLLKMSLTAELKNAFPSSRITVKEAQ
jgi:hypothetical protein